MSQFLDERTGEWVGSKPMAGKRKYDPIAYPEKGNDIYKNLRGVDQVHRVRA